LLVWLVDYLSKRWALSALAGKSKSFLFLKFELTSNSGAAFGMGANWAGIFLGIFSSVACALVFFYAPRIVNKFWALVFALVLGGALGNLTDRAFKGSGFLQGSVTDWIVLPHWPNFNIADSSIVCAAVLAFLLSFKNIHPIAPNDSSKNA
jgi:signal peptidase II